jgi:transcriptional regulator with XRE-family HTH domain
MSQREFGAATGSSHRTAARWDAGRATPAPHHLRRLACLLYPEHRELATEAADAADETLESLGLEAAPPPLPPPLPPQAAHRPEDIVDIVVLTAVDQTGAPVATARSLLHAVFKRAAELGLSVEAVEKALRPAAVRSERDDTH